MQKQFLPSGEYVLISPSKGPKLVGASLKLDILVGLAKHGAFASEKGHATSDLLDYINSDARKIYAPAVLKELAQANYVKRDTKTTRTYYISVNGCIWPKNLWERVKLVLDRAPQQEVVPAIPVVSTETRTEELTLPQAIADLTVALTRVVELLTPKNSSEELETLRADNARLREELNRVSNSMRASSNFQSTKIQKQQPTNGELNLRSLGVKDSKMRILLRHAHDHGFRIQKTGGEHIRVIPPGDGQIVHSASTPSDRRGYENFYHDLVRLGKMPPLPDRS